MEKSQGEKGDSLTIPDLVERTFNKSLVNESFYIFDTGKVIRAFQSVEPFKNSSQAKKETTDITATAGDTAIPGFDIAVNSFTADTFLGEHWYHLLLMMSGYSAIFNQDTASVEPLTGIL